MIEATGRKVSTLPSDKHELGKLKKELQASLHLNEELKQNIPQASEKLSKLEGSLREFYEEVNRRIEAQNSQNLLSVL